jgi:hypothetical protein
MCGVQAMTVTPWATAARAIVRDTDKFGAPSSSPGSRWQCRSIKGPGPSKAYFCKGLRTHQIWHQHDRCLYTATKHVGHRPVGNQSVFLAASHCENVINFNPRRS